MNKQTFDRAIKDLDFSIGDNFWLNGIEFEVTNKRELGYCLKCGKQEMECECDEEDTLN